LNSQEFNITSKSAGSKGIFLLGLVFLFCIKLKAQNLDLRYSSNVFLSSIEDANALRLRIFTLEENCIRITSPIGKLDTVLALQANSLSMIDLGEDFDPYLANFELVDSSHFFSYTIYSKRPIAVQQYNSNSTSSSQDPLSGKYFTKTLIPDIEASKSYYTINQKYQRSGQNNSIVYILGLHDSTVIQTRSPFNYANSKIVNSPVLIPAGSGSITLSAGESTRAINGDLDGFNEINMNDIHLEANKPFKLMVHDWGGTAGYSNEAQPCLPLLSNNIKLNVLYNIEKSRSRFYLVPVNEQGADYVHLVAEEANTQIYWDGSLVKTLNQGDYWDSCFFNSGMIESNKPIFLGQFVQADHPFPCPYEVYGTMSYGINDADFFENFHFKVDTNELPEHYPYLVLLSPIDDTASVVINGPSNVLNNWQQIANSQMAWSRYLLDTQEYQINAPLKAAAYLYSCSYTNTSQSNIQIVSSTKLRGLNSQSDSIENLEFRFLNDGQYQLLTSDTVSLCLGEGLKLLSPNQAVSSWNMLIDEDSVIFGNNDFGQDTFSFSFSSSGYHSIRLEDERGCEQSKEFWVKVEESPNLEWDYEWVENCEGELLKLMAQGNSVQIEWKVNGSSYFGDTVFVPISSESSKNEVEFIYSLGSCIDSMTLALSRGNQLNNTIFPNILTPNGDGINDIWCFHDLKADYESCFQITIMNRWGQAVYSSQNPNDCWSPKNLKSGVYYYAIQLGSKTVKGFIHLL